MSFYNSVEKVRQKLEQPKRQYNVHMFPSDLETDGHTSIFMIYINAVEGSKYIGQKYNVIQGEEGTPTYRRRSGTVASRFNQNTKRIDTAIALYMPNEITSTYTSDYGAVDLGLAGDMASHSYNFGIAEFGKDGIWKQIKEASIRTGESAARGGGNILAGTVGALTGINAQDTKKAMTFEMKNPFTEVIFNGVQNRTFSFTFRFVPRSVEEQQEVKNIVDTLKFHRAPEFVKSGFMQHSYWKFPSEFDIQFLHRGVENPWIFKVSTCALTNLVVNHGGEGQFAVHEDGSPVVTDLNLEFTELETLTKERIQDGF